MAPKYVYTEVKGKKLKISNLDKLLYPNSEVTKAQVIQYYLDIAPYILKYIKMRPLTLIRFPDGIDKTKFYAKSIPDWAPQWIDGIDMEHSEETVRYVVPQDEACLVWLANLAALELHPMQMKVDSMDLPDHFIFDLDPPEEGNFEELKQIALKLQPFLESKGHRPFVKTSGSKGLHIYVPIIKKLSHEAMTDYVKKLAKAFVAQNKESCTLAMSKVKREGKTLIDIFRNHKAHTTVAPYSLRGKSGAPISFPIPWQLVPELKSSQEITIQNYRAYLDEYGDPWHDFYEAASPITVKEATTVSLAPEISDKLQSYIDKRDLEKSPEPGVEQVTTSGNQFCIQIHDAQNLHYDLRLEQDGVLMSWAIPKGLPFRKGVKRLAIRTEDHPLKYLDFEGTIPKGAYGAGKMWVFTNGEIEWKEKKEAKYRFRLVAKYFNRSYSLYRTKDQHWLIEMTQNEDFDQIEMPPVPMLAGMRKEVPSSPNYIYEIKWDGIRCIFHLDDNRVTIYSRSGRDISEKFPELLDPDMFEVESGIFDGEIVNLDDEGRPIFSNIISRMHSVGERSITNGMKRFPAVGYLFDCIFLDGKFIDKEPLMRRQAWLKVALKRGKAFRISEAIPDGKALFEATKKMNLEGIMAKDKHASYSIGQRSDSWLKIKHRSTDICFIAGYTAGQGDRVDLFGALHVVKKDDHGDLKYMGKVGTGFDSDKMKLLLHKLAPLVIKQKAFEESTEDDRNSTWTKPELSCVIQYASLASSGVYREPVFLKLIE